MALAEESRALVCGDGELEPDQLTITGPSITELVNVVVPQAMRDAMRLAMRVALPEVMAELKTRAPSANLPGKPSRLGTGGELLAWIPATLRDIRFVPWGSL